MLYIDEKIFPYKRKPNNSRRAQAIICEFMNSNTPIACVDWERWGYSSFDSCRMALNDSIRIFSEPIKVLTRKKIIYLVDYSLIKTI